MKMDIYLQKTSNVFAQNKLLKLVVLVIGIVTVYNSFLLKKALNTHRTILVPPVITERLEVQADDASDAYIKHFSQYAIELALIYSPGNAKRRFEELLTLYAPDSYPGAKEVFYYLIEKIKIAQVSNVFYINHIELDRVNKKVGIHGIRRRYIRDVMKEKTTTYELTYEIKNGRFMIISIFELDKDKRSKLDETS